MELSNIHYESHPILGMVCVADVIDGKLKYKAFLTRDTLHKIKRNKMDQISLFTLVTAGGVIRF